MLLEAMSDRDIASAFYPKVPGHPIEVAKVEADFLARSKELKVGKKYKLSCKQNWSDQF